MTAFLEEALREEDRTARRIRSWFALLFMLMVTPPLLVMGMHRGWFASTFAVFTLVLDVVAYGVALLLYLPALLAVVLERRVVATLLAFALVVTGIGGTITLQYSLDIRVRARFAVEHPAFAAAARLAREGALPGLHDYAGARLPGHLCFVAADCRISVIGHARQGPVLFLVDWMGWPDDAIGYAQFPGEPPRAGSTTGSG
ncbi:hypothetical protein [Thermocatellispora tengchongensis]|uniref:hypothetical protein n=1 Tax=Thermocatellispora tengchongensis TaxID=1073253 RepID=UPI0036453C11